MQSPSPDILKTKIRNYLGGNPRFAEITSLFEGDENCVLFGNILELLLNHDLFINSHRPIKLWALSRAHARLVELFLGLSSGDVGIIPRYELFPVTDSARPLNLSSPIDIVYSGRIVRGKNVELLPKVAATIKNQLSVNVNLHIAHVQFDESMEELQEVSRQEQIILHDHGNLGVDWINSFEFANPLLVNLSTYSYEDYNVSVAQAQSAGWPLLVSSWGAFLDLTGPGVAHMPLEVMADIKSHQLELKEILARLSTISSDKVTNYQRAAVQLNEADLVEKVRCARDKIIINGKLSSGYLKRLVMLTLSSRIEE